MKIHRDFFFSRSFYNVPTAGTERENDCNKNIHDDPVVQKSAPAASGNRDSVWNIIDNTLYYRKMSRRGDQFNKKKKKTSSGMFLYDL